MHICSIQLPDRPLFLAPMHEVTDQPFRLICKRMGADVMVTEFVSVEALIREVAKAKAKMQVLEQEHPIGIQIFGANDGSFKDAVAVAERFKPDFIDISAGCSVGKHAGRGECAGLLRDLPRFERIVKETVNATSLPVTVKTRLGWNAESLVILDVAKMVEQAGAKALTVHCRTKVQNYKGAADWSWLEKIKKVISIPLIGNGDVFSPQDAKRMFETGCDGVMIGRGALTNPWIFRQVRHYLDTGAFLPEPTIEERVALFIDHLHLYTGYTNRCSGLYAFRKYYAGYLKGIPGVAKLRNDLMTLTEMDDIQKRLEAFLSLHHRQRF